MFNDALDSLNVDEIESQSTLTGTLHTHGAILFDQAHKLLRLAELAPGEGSGQKQPHEPLRLRPDIGSLPDHPLWVTPGVGLKLVRVIVIVGAALTRVFLGMRFYKLALEENANQPAIAPHRNFLSKVEVRNGVQGLCEDDVMVGMNFQAVRPLGCVETVATQGP